MINDRMQDQIMLHSSRGWHTRLIEFLLDNLKNSQWSISYKNGGPTSNDVIVFFKHPKIAQKIVFHVMHGIPPGITHKNTVLITDTVIPDTNQFCKVISLNPEVYGEFQIDITYKNLAPSKAFNCFINRGDNFRQSWLYQLTRRNLLDSGHVSYWCEDRTGKLEPVKYFERLFQGNEIFEQEHRWLKDKIPYKNFDLSLEDAIIDSKISLIIETGFWNDNNISFSEKIWRQLQLPRPWVMFNSVGSVNYLRSLGFDVFDDYVDHAYDNETDAIKRQLMILEQLDTNIEFTDAVLTDLQVRSEHNQKILKSYRQQLPEKYKKIVEEIKNISNNESLP